MKDKYLRETRMVDFSNPAIQKLIQNMKWKEMGEFERIKAIYNYVRDDVLFGYNIDDGISASKVLADGYGQCNTKGTLFMALLRACNIPCRVHGFTIDKRLQKGAMTGFVYRNAPQNVLHSWVEVYLDDTWYELEAFILDKKYLNKLQKINSQCSGAFCGYGVAVKDFQNPVIDFEKNNTYIQNELPPTPIANPSIKSIKAVLEPSDTDYLYFVASIDGGNVYSKTYEEHKKNVEKYRKDRDKRNKELEEKSKKDK